MITQFYPNPNKQISHPASVSLYPYNHVNQIGSESYIKYWAEKRGVTEDEYRRRDALVRAQALKATYWVNSRVYPFKWSAYEEKGSCRVLKIDRTYADYTEPWQAEGDGPLYIVEAISEKNNFNIFRATAGYFQKDMPTQPENEQVGS